MRRYAAKSMISTPLARFIARGREDAPAAPRRASLIVFAEINCFRPGDPQHCASQGVQLPVAAAHAGKLTSVAHKSGANVRYGSNPAVLA